MKIKTTIILVIIIISLSPIKIIIKLIIIMTEI